jgi:dolichol-phosphate mannosyltransferase
VELPKASPGSSASASPRGPDRGLSIVIPAWNEADRLGPTLARYVPMLEARGRPFEIVVVADGDTDGTAAVARGYAERGVRVLEFPEKLGKGGAVLAGLHQAKFEYVGYLDADGPVGPNQVFGMVDSLDQFDGVVASRWVRGSRILESEPLFNLVAGRIWNFLVRSLLFLPLQDTQCGAKFFRRAIVLPTLRAVALTNRSFDVALLYHLRKSGHRLKEVPVTWGHDRNSRMPIGKAIPIMLLSLLGIRLMNLPLGRRIPPSIIRWFQQKWGQV